ncbi:MAG: hypothetical protein V4850_01585 [Myxococcota bacterium]
MLLFLSLFACAGSKEVEDPSAHACEHIAESEATLPGGNSTGNAVVIPMDGEPYTVTLQDSIPSYLSVQIDADTPALLFAGTADVVSGLYNGDEAVTLPEPAPNADCPEDIPEHFDLEFDTVGTWYIQLGPAAVTEVWLSLAPAEGHAHDEGEE